MSDQVTLAVEQLLRPDLRLQLEGYDKAYDDYPARVFRPQAVLSPTGFEDATNDIPFGLELLLSIGTGSSCGTELAARGVRGRPERLQPQQHQRRPLGSAHQRVRGQRIDRRAADGRNQRRILTGTMGVVCRLHEPKRDTPLDVHGS